MMGEAKILIENLTSICTFFLNFPFKAIMIWLTTTIGTDVKFNHFVLDLRALSVSGKFRLLGRWGTIQGTGLWLILSTAIFSTGAISTSVANRWSLDRFCFSGNDLDTEKEERRFKINFHITYDQFYFSGILKTAWWAAQHIWFFRFQDLGTFTS